MKVIGLIGGMSWESSVEYYRIINQEVKSLEMNGIRVIVPNEKEREIINKVIYEELCLGNIQQKSRGYYKQVIQGLIESGAEGIILGCTEIGLLVKPEDSDVPLFDTAYIHAFEAVNMSLE